MRALSAHTAALEATLRPGHGRVEGAYGRAVNLRLADGAWLFLVHPDLGNGPDAVRVDGDWPLPWAPGDRVATGAGAIRGPGLPLDVSGALLWSPPPAPSLAALEQRAAAAAEAAGRLPAPAAGLLAGPLARGVHALQAGDWPAAVRGLAGLGPGLTPAGDDLLAGSACLLARAGRLPPGLAAALAGLPPGATTPLSRHLLARAAQGVAGEHHLAFVDALLAGAAPAPLAALLAHGATSGRDFAAGAILAVHTLGQTALGKDGSPWP